MPPHRDLAAFDERASTYDQGRHARLHHEISARTAALAAATVTAPGRVLDVGCGTGYLLRLLARSYPNAIGLMGVDPAPTMVEVAEDTPHDARLGFAVAVAERLPHPDDTFDLVVSTTSFDHWSDQRAGLAECSRVMNPGGRLVLVDQFSLWLAPTMLFSRQGKARTQRQAARLLADAGFSSPEWHSLYAVIIKAVTAAV